MSDNDDDWTVDSSTLEKLTEKYGFLEHPLFMEKLPENIHANPTLVALNTIINEEQTSEERVQGFYEQGNEIARMYKSAKNKNQVCLDAIACYTKALEELEIANTLKSQYAKTIEDCTKSLEADPKNFKAAYRGVRASAQLGLYKKCIDFSLKGLRNVDSENRQYFEDMLKEAEHKYKACRESDRNISNSEQISVEGVDPANTCPYDLSILNNRTKPRFVDNIIVWPCLVLYPEVNVAEAIIDFYETDDILVHLQVMFPVSTEKPPPYWDPSQRYVYNNLEVFFEAAECRMIKVPLNVPLAKLLIKIKKISQVPILHIMVKDSLEVNNFYSDNKVINFEEL